ncbi:hypothetical protein FHW69_001045 [Luteibacter sp. Sphag1AF]|uniref:hypothetical protein n=1 Tax=Luteibacter sp. Sphag1AF TaxID=2587031 RepID=UPI00160D789D|nr:hypothetical protein [Luteibacter sp. Sphag1AF]MBB3226455.1 hypothetical protein [Luteibacter sp. Sphag1AF]
MEHIWGIVILAGMASMVLAQGIAGVMSFVMDPMKAMLCFVIPGFMFCVINRTRMYRPMLGLWLGGALAIFAGAIALAA